MMIDKRFLTPKSLAEFMGTDGVKEHGSPLELDSSYADALCNGIAEIMKERDQLRARVGEMEARYDRVTISLKEKCAELAAIKPDWEAAPPEADWLAQDEDTNWLFWEKEPVPGQQCRINEWENGGDYYETTVKGWKDTLERRPEATE